MKTPKEITPKEALERLEILCARAEHSSGEMYRKLRLWHITGDEADQIVARLRSGRFIDDRRFARAYVNDKAKMARWGRRKIENGLYAKGIDHDIMRDAIAEIDDELYRQNLKDLIKAKIKSAPALLESYEGRTKIFRFIVSRGYEPDLAVSALKECLSEH